MHAKLKYNQFHVSQNILVVHILLVLSIQFLFKLFDKFQNCLTFERKSQDGL